MMKKKMATNLGFLSLVEMAERASYSGCSVLSTITPSPKLVLGAV